MAETFDTIRTAVTDIRTNLQGADPDAAIARDRITAVRANLNVVEAHADAPAKALVVRDLRTLSVLIQTRLKLLQQRQDAELVAATRATRAETMNELGQLRNALLDRGYAEESVIPLVGQPIADMTTMAGRFAAENPGTAAAVAVGGFFGLNYLWNKITGAGRSVGRGAMGVGKKLLIGTLVAGAAVLGIEVFRPGTIRSIMNMFTPGPTGPGPGPTETSAKNTADLVAALEGVAPGTAIDLTDMRLLNANPDNAPDLLGLGNRDIIVGAQRLRLERAGAGWLFKVGGGAGRKFRVTHTVNLLGGNASFDVGEVLARGQAVQIDGNRYMRTMANFGQAATRRGAGGVGPPDFAANQAISLLAGTPRPAFISAASLEAALAAVPAAGAGPFNVDITQLEPHLFTDPPATHNFPGPPPQALNSKVRRVVFTLVP